MIERVDTPGAPRHYRCLEEGWDYESVTAFIDRVVPKPYLVPWAARRERDLVAMMAREGLLDQLHETTPAHMSELKRAADFGTAVHQRIERWLRGAPGNEGPAVTDHAFAAAVTWALGVRLEYDEADIERVVWSHELEIAGTSDLVRCTLLEGERRVRGVLDWKTSRSHHLEHELQDATYWLCAVELGLYQPYDDVWGVVVKLPHQPGTADVTLMTPGDMKTRADQVRRLKAAWGSGGILNSRK